MRSHVRIKLAGTIRTELDEFAERWVKFTRANELVPDDTTVEEASNLARLGLEIFANLLEGAEYSGFENVIRRLLHDWIDSANSYTDLLKLEEAFPIFIIPHLDINPDSEDSDEVLYALGEFFHSDLRACLLSDYLQVYEEIIGKESSHTGYILSHFDAILNLTAILNCATARSDILDNLSLALSGLFENVIGVALWTESENGLRIYSTVILDEEVPALVMDQELPEKIEEIYNLGEARWVQETDIPPGLRSLIDIETMSGLSACALPIRPGEAYGVLAMLVIGSEQPGTMELSLSRVASAECALAFDRVNERSSLDSVNQTIRNILSLSRETAWGSGSRETADTIIDYLLGLTSSGKAILLGLPSRNTGSEPVIPLAWRDLSEDALKMYQRASRLPAIASIAVKSRVPILILANRLKSVLGGKEPPPGFAPSDREAIGILPLERHGEVLGVCIFLCSWKFAIESESKDLLAIFGRTAADSLATAREFERSLKMTKLVEEDLKRVRILQEKLTPGFLRSGNLVCWANFMTTAELAGDVLVIRDPAEGIINLWMADVAEHGTATGWSVMFIRQLLADIPHKTCNPLTALNAINSRLNEIESESSSGIFSSLIGIHLDEDQKIGRFASAGAPRLFKVASDGSIETFDPEGLPLGLFDDARLEELEFIFAPGEKLVWASHGLLGARNESGSNWGETGLLNCIRKAYFLPAKALYDSILTGVGEFSPGDDIIEDRSLVVIGYDPPPGWEKIFTGDERLDIIDPCLKWLSEKQVSGCDFNACRLLINEAIRNAHEHGNKLNGNSKIELKVRHSTNHVQISVRDEGGKLNDRVTSPVLKPEKILEDKGRGFLLMRHESDYLWVEETSGELNTVRLLGKGK